MSEQEEWGPWIEHDGAHCPRGEYVNTIAFDGEEWFGIAGAAHGSTDYYYGGWFFDIDNPLADHVFKYRIRKPKGLTILQSIIRRQMEPA